MKKRVSFVLSTAVLGFLGATQPASAANLTWDPSHTGTASDGSGNWNTTDANWWNGSADVAVTPLAQSNGVASGATVTGSPVISLLSTAGMTVGQYFGGTNVPIGSTILSIDTGLNKVTISANATGNANNQLFQAADKLTIGAGTGAGGTITLTAPAGVNTLTFAANSGNYIINESGTAALTLTAGPNAPTNLTIASGTNVTFNNEVSLTNPNQAGTINVADGQTLTFAKAGNALSSTLVGGANSTVKVTGNTGAGNLGIVN
ncbi:MAG TPA: hypothetical protein VNB29_02330, partial [Chthoniobacterales bacterium]|nr:hypothetical protein [Chthoniobacterales bacterium]